MRITGQGAAKIYRALLFAYPAEFRHEYGPEMRQLFADRLGREPLLRLWLDTLADIAISAPREHLHILLADLRYGARILAKTPAFSVVAVLVMALGIAATTAVFSLVNAVLLRSLPYGDPGRLVYVWTPNSRLEGQMVPSELLSTWADFYDWRRLSKSFSNLTALNEHMFNLAGGGTVIRVHGAQVTGNFFETLATKPELGRAIDASDDRAGHEHVVVIGEELWHAQFGGATDAIGKTLLLNRQKYTVIGVMPRDFGYPREGDVPHDISGFQKTEIWVPLALGAKDKSDRSQMNSPDVVIGRLKPGVSLARAQAEMSAIEAPLNSLYPPEWKGWKVLVKTLVSTILGPVEQMLWLLLGAVTLVLLIACSNVANLLMARITGRMREMGLRTALGAGRGWLVRQLLTESLMLAAAGGALGVFLAYSAVRALVRLNPGNIPRFEEISLDERVLLFGLAATLLSGVLFGLMPAVAGSRVNVVELLKQGGNKGIAGSSNRLRHALIAIQVALSVILLSGAGLLIRSYLKLEEASLGFRPSSLTLKLTLDERYQKREQRVEFFRRFMEEARRVPGVSQMGAVTDLPLDHSESVGFLEVKGLTLRKNELIDWRRATTGYFRAMGIPLLSGRFFSDTDIRAAAPVSIVNSSFVARYLKGRDALGTQVCLGMGDCSKSWTTIVGVVGDIRHTTLEEKPRPEVFGPLQPGFFEGRTNFAFHAEGAPGPIVTSLRQVLHRLDATLAFEDVHTMGERVAEAGAQRRFQTALLIAFAGAAVLLASVGLYGLMMYAVRQRTAELGLRIALGASRRQVLAMVLRHGLTLVMAGLLIGVAGALGLTRLMTSWLYGVQATDPVTFIAVPGLIILIGVAACLIPAWQATRVDPITSLRYD